MILNARFDMFIDAVRIFVKLVEEVRVAEVEILFIIVGQNIECEDVVDLLWLFFCGLVL
jgi:uncharacterized Rmd1/YagE family protein